MSGALQLEPVGAEGVGVEDAGAGLHILPVDGGDGLRLFQTQQRGVMSQLNALLLQHGAKAAV